MVTSDPRPLIRTQITDVTRGAWGPSFLIGGGERGALGPLYENRRTRVSPSLASLLSDARARALLVYLPLHTHTHTQRN